MSSNIQIGWNSYIMDVEMAKHYHLVNADLSPRNPILDYLLPSLLYLKLVAILDEVLDEFIKSYSLSKPKKYRNDLNGRIEFLNEVGKLKNYNELVRLRKERNSYAHESTKFGSWNELESDIDLVESELMHLGYVGVKPKYNFFSERSQIKDSPDKEIAFSQDYKFGLKKADVEVLVVSYTKHHYKG